MSASSVGAPLPQGTFPQGTAKSRAIEALRLRGCARSEIARTAPNRFSRVSPVVLVHPDDITPTWKVALKKIVQIAFHLILAIGAILGAYYLLPVSIGAVMLPFIGMGAVLTSFSLFSSSKAQLTPVASAQLKAPVIPVVPLPIDAPRGIVNGSANCWINSLAQTIRCDKGFMEWIAQTPDFMGANLMPALRMPMDLLYSEAELAAHPIEMVPMTASIPRVPLPEDYDFYLPDDRFEFRTLNDVAYIKWICSQPELELLPEHCAEVFSDDLPDNHLRLETLPRFPEHERVRRTKNAETLVTKLRVVATAQKMNEDERELFYEKILEVRNGLNEFRSLRKTYPNVPFMDAYQVIETITPEAITNLSATLPHEGREAFEDLFVALGEVVLRHPLLKEFILTANHLAKLVPDSRSTFHRYLSVLNGIEPDKRSAALNLLNAFKNFFNNYNQNEALNNRLVTHSSQNLRAAFSRFSGMISPHSHEQHDPAEAMRLLEAIMPPELKYDLEVRRIYDTTGLPAIVDCPSNIRVLRELNPGQISVDVLKGNYNLQQMINTFGDKPAHTDPNELRLMGVDGQERIYPLLREQHQFVRAPASLWPTVKRFEYGKPWDFFHWLLPSCFPAPAERSTKIETPIQFDDVIELSTIEDGVVRYQLDSFIVHLGKSTNSGHYISYKLKYDEAGLPTWYEMNDSVVRKVSGEQLTKAARQAYLPHYSKIVPQ
jgi:hypothetical protein